MTEVQAPKFKFKKRSNASFKKKQLRRTADDHHPNNGGVVKSEVGAASNAVGEVPLGDGAGAINDVEAVATDNCTSIAATATATTATATAADVIPSNNEMATADTIISDNRVKHNSAHDDYDYDDDDEEEQSTLLAIMAVERRKKVLGTGRMASRGMDTASLLQNKKITNNNRKHLNRIRRMNKGDSHDNNANSSSKHDNSEGGAAAAMTTKNKDLEERLKGTFAGGKLAGSNDMGGDEDGGILAKKHKLAMEDFIQKNLNSISTATAAAAGDDGASSGVGGIDGSNNGEARLNDIEKELYAGILVDENQSSTGDATGGTGAAAESTEEGDVGAGGTMMGGTGIAEVALPIDERIKALKETEKAALFYERARRNRFGGGAAGAVMGDDGGDNIGGYDAVGAAKSSTAAVTSNMIPMSFAAGPGKRKRQDAGPSSFGVEVSQSQTVASKSAQIDSSSYHVHSSALPPSSYSASASTNPYFSASSAGPDVHRSDVSTLGASYSHNFQLHTKEWVTRRRDERQTEIDEIHAQRETEEGPPASRARVGFEVARKMAKGEVILPAGAVADGRGGSGGGGAGGTGALKNEWDKNKGGDPRSNDDRVWKTFMSNQRNRR